MAESILARAQKTFSIPGSHQILIDYQEGTNPIYVGVAEKSIPTSAELWLVQKITWDENNNPTMVQSAVGAWDSRTDLGYN